MADVAIIHAADKGAAATRLADAIAAAGFAVGAVEVDDPAGLADSVETSDADATILIWSRPLVSHALHSGDLPRIRRLRGLIEVSADGITPPSRGDETRIVSISGWRGQPFHPGWQRVHLELKRLCGARRAAPEAAPAAAVVKNRPPPAAPSASRDGSRPWALRLMLGGGAAVLLVAAAVGASNWVGQDRPDPGPPREAPEPRGPAAIAGAGRPAPGPAPQAPTVSATAPPSSGPAPSPRSPAASRPSPAASSPEADSRAARRRPASLPKQRILPQVAAVKKYSRKNSKVMRDFCARSGRSTPQCRTFLRSIRDAEATD